MKKAICRTAALCMAAVLLFPVQAQAVSAEKGIVLDALTGQILWERRADERSLIASTTKIMTAHLICRECNVLERVKIPREAVGIEGSSMYLREGEILTVQELLWGLMLRSGNDAAAALAIYCGGSIEGFARKMNAEAVRLGLTGSHFVNPHGLDDPDHYSTARDLAVLTAEAMKNPVFAGTVSTKTARVGERVLTNHNKLLWCLPGADGVKTGYTKAAGRLLVSSAMRNGRRLICVTVNAPDDWNDHRELLEAAFGRYRETRIVTKGQPIGTLAVPNGEIPETELLAAADFDFPLAEDETVSFRLPELEFRFAPVYQGEPAGTAGVYLGETELGRIPLVIGRDSEPIKEQRKPLWRRIFGG